MAPEFVGPSDDLVHLVRFWLLPPLLISGGGASRRAENHPQDVGQVPQGENVSTLFHRFALIFIRMIENWIFFQISGDVSGFDCILVDDMVGVELLVLKQIYFNWKE